MTVGVSGLSAAGASDRPRPLVDTGWLRARLGDPDVRVVHVSLDRGIYDERHIPGAVFVDLHTDLAKRGRVPETGDVEREWLVPDRAEVERTLQRWGVAPGDRVVLYDDVGKNRHAIRGYWLLRYYGWAADRVHVLDGGLDAWARDGGELTAAVPAPRALETVRLSEPDPRVVATAREVAEWSRESVADGSVRLLDVRTPEEYRGVDIRAARGGHIPGAVNVEWTAFLTPDGRLRPGHEIRAIAAQAAGGDPSTLRAAYCQGGVRAALASFALRELAGLDVRNYAGSWEEWGNLPDAPVDADPRASG